MAGKRKRWLAIGLAVMAVMVGCMVPVGTMKASEDVPTAEITIKIMLDSDDITQSINTPVASDVKAYNNHGKAFVVTANDSTSLTYYLDKDDTINARSEEELAGLCKEPVPNGGRIPLSEDGKYVLYVKAVVGNETVYAGSKYRVVVDTKIPEIEGITDQSRYPEGQTFTVKDDNDVTVTINEQIVSPDSAGKYTIQAQQYANNYVIKAKDIAGNWSDTVTVYLTDTAPEPEEPADNMITKPGTYSLQSDKEYKLGDGAWKVAGDSSVYPGGITFYASGTYTFQKQ